MRLGVLRRPSDETKGNRLPIVVRLLSVAFCLSLAAVIGFGLVACKTSSSSAADDGIGSLDVGDTPKPVEIGKVWPLTGLPAKDNDPINRRPLSIKIENSPVARPQLGISHADVVYESVTEGGITRFNCIFQSDIPDEVGPVRSARNTDISIVPQYQGLFFYSGANSTVEREIRNAGIDNMGNTPAESLYYRVRYRAAPHNLYLKLSDAYQVAEKLRLTTTLKSPPTLSFLTGDQAVDAGSAAGKTAAVSKNSTNSGTDSDSADSTKSSASSDGSQATTPDEIAAIKLTVPLSDDYVVNWDYSSSKKVYARSMGSAKSLDAESSQPIEATNVVVLWASYVPGVIANRSQTYNVDLKTTGQASLFMGGKRIDGTWKAGAKTPPRFYDKLGQEIYLTPGKTWFEVVDTKVKLKVSGS
ncbi:MAG: DUF3048 domain-containing protein [Actinomycetia bacterium]|nr:DUF3048 domain-containing protein [Actinomycetes bacterium]